MTYIKATFSLWTNLTKSGHTTETTSTIEQLQRANISGKRDEANLPYENTVQISTILPSSLY
jgi:hypothetical protein